MNADVQATLIFKITEYQVSSEEFLFNLNGREEDYIFHSAKLEEFLPSVEDKQYLFEGVFYMDSTIQHYKRSIYTFWDFLGDVGGLTSILQ